MTTNVTLKAMIVNLDVNGNSEVINETIDIAGLLKGTELATETPASPGVSPTAVEVNTSELTIANVAVNTAEQTVDGRTVAVGKGIDYTISGFVSGKYTVEIVLWTSATVAAKRVCFAKYEVCG